MHEEIPVSSNPETVVRWIKNLKIVDDEEVYIENMKGRTWVVRRSKLERNILFLANCDITMRFDGVRADGDKIMFFLRGLQVCTMYPGVGWLARRVKE